VADTKETEPKTPPPYDYVAERMKRLKEKKAKAEPKPKE